MFSFGRRSFTWQLGMVAVMAAGFAPSFGGPVDFSRDVLPILSEYCFQCHGPDEQARKAKLRLDTKEGAFRIDGKGRAIIAPGSSSESELIRRIVTADPDEVMPPPRTKQSLTTAQLTMLRRWIDEGAPWGQHWAFQKPAKASIPEVIDSSWPRNDVDRHVLSRLVREGLAPAPQARPETLVRRVALDLTGLPPKVEDVSEFLESGSDASYERLVDRLLASPHFGERMAWEWLDAARYADSNGYQGDAERTMWPWRDWVVQAFNRNLPFDQFTVWQLAGDLLPKATEEQRLATGFLRNHMINGEGGRIPEENRVEYVMDMTETTGTVWLGLTFNCTRCHDHKYDPLSQRDYFRMFAFFNQTPVDGSGGNPQTKPVLELPTPEQREQMKDVEQRLETAARRVTETERTKFPREDGAPVKAWPGFDELPKEVQEALQLESARRDGGRLEKLIAHWKPIDPQYAEFLDHLRSVWSERAELAKRIPRVMVMEDQPGGRETFVLSKGLYDQPRDPVGAGVPENLPPMPPDAPANRLGLAQWIVSPENPLTARVIVNRLWQQFFGVGLVKTAEDFGVQGEKPVHPELLDWLALEFINSGWNVKHLCRLITMSATYRQSSAGSPELFERDPENRLLARGPRHRMPSWMIRDSALAASGLLEPVIAGSPVNPYQPPGVWEEATFGNKKYRQDAGSALYRRSIYTFWRRIVSPTLFFDSASRQVCTVKLPQTNTPLHALTTLNDVTYIEAARALAGRVLLESDPDPGERIDRIFNHVLGRTPSLEEKRLLIAAIARHVERFRTDPASAELLLAVGESPRDERIPSPEHAAYTVLCSTLMNTDEALTKE